ncbi:hypothetical protein [Borreliella garinii]|uniref:hypothetical protein n=1 Tax=Borreliella garinii TaxID=29519 RepID=UPI001FEEA566|nr:hypothetical protein [Borreliella garinii]
MARSIEEIKFASGGARFISNKPTHMPNLGVMSSKFGQPELVRITPTPIIIIAAASMSMCLMPKTCWNAEIKSPFNGL